MTSFDLTALLPLLEPLAVVTGIGAVTLTVGQRLSNWPIGILSSALFLGLFLSAGLYADSMLQLLYIVLGLLAKSRHEDAVNERAQATAQDEQNAAQSLATGATIAFVAGGIVTAAGLTWLGIRAFTPAQRVSVLAGPGSVIVKGTF